MSRIFENPEAFDLLCISAFILSLPVSVYLFSISRYLLGLLSSILAIWALLCIIARLIFGPAYIEGHLVRLLLKHKGLMQESELLKYYEQYGSMRFVLDRLELRDVIKVESGVVKLVGNNYQIGYKNNLMMWGTRRVKI